MARREYVQTTQFSRNQILDLMAYNLAIKDAKDNTDIEWLEDEIYAVRTTIKLAKFVTGTSASSILQLASAVYAMKLSA